MIAVCVRGTRHAIVGGVGRTQTLASFFVANRVVNTITLLTFWPSIVADGATRAILANHILLALILTAIRGAFFTTRTSVFENVSV